MVLCTALAERMSDVRSQTVMRPAHWWSEAPRVALVSQLAAQDNAPFGLSAFFINLEAKRRDDREKEKEEKKTRRIARRRELCPEDGGGPTCSGDVQNTANCRDAARA